MEIVVTIVGTVLTAIGTGVTLWQASSVKSYGRRIAFDLRKINLSEASDSLNRAQDEGRKLLTQVNQLNRGKNYAVTTEAIQANIDKALNLLPLKGEDSDIRGTIVRAQGKLRESQTTNDDDARKTCVSDMHAHIQDAISLIKERLVALARDQRNG